MRDRVAAAAFLGVLAIDLATLCPSVFVGDSGELITAAHSLGIVQPTGFPLYMLLAKILTLVPAGSVAARVNLLSALSCAVTALAAYAIVARGERRSVALAAALLVGTSRTIWAQSVVARTYPITQAFLAVELAMALALFDRPPGRRAFLALCALVGLSSGTHLLWVVFLPVLLALGLRERPRRRALAVLLLAAGALQYAYVPIRSRPAAGSYNVFGPVLTPARFWAYLTEAGYRQKQFARSGANLGSFFARVGRALATQTTPIVLPLTLWGLLSMHHRMPRALQLAVLMGIANLFILIAYGDDRDIYFLDRYFLWLYFLEAIALGVGVARAIEAARTHLGAAPSRVVATALGGVILYGATGALARADRSRTLVPLAFGHALLDPLPRGALLFVGGDSPLFICDYLQRCEGVRTDVGVGTSERFATLVEMLTRRPRPQGIFTDFVPGELPADVLARPYGMVWRVERIPPRGTAQPPLPAPSPDPLAPPMAAVFAQDPAYSDYETAALGAQYQFIAGLAALAEGHEAQARECFDRALSIAPESRLVRYNLARVMAGRHERERALALLDEALALDLSASGDPGARDRWIEFLKLGPVPAVSGAPIRAPWASPSPSPASASPAR